MRRFLSFVLLLTLCFSLLPSHTVFADSGDIITPEIEDLPIHSVIITVTEPKLDEHPDLHPQLPSDAKYEIVPGSVKWFDQSRSVYLTENDVFASGVYTLSLQLKGISGYAFLSIPANCTVNQTTPATSLDSANDLLLVNVSFTQAEAAHTPGTPVEEHRIEATCTENGSYEEVIFCTTCGRELSRTAKVLPATGHDYELTKWNWSTDYSAATVTFTCKNDSTHVETVTASVTSKTVDPTCTTAGSITYTATAAFEGQTYTDSKTVPIEATGHDYELTKWNWSNDCTTATVTFTCKNDSSHVETVTASVTSKTVDPTCTAAGNITYTATAAFEGQTFTDSKTVPIEATGHDYELTKWTWSNDYTTATVTFTCKNDPAHVQTVTATVTTNTVDPTCTTAGSITYKATVSFEGKTYTDTKTVPIEATGHDYELTKWTWSTDYKTATVTFTCKNDPAHVQTVTASVTSKTVDPTCTVAGSTTYTATASFEGQTYTDTKTVPIEATGHDYALTKWTWSTDYKTATATFTCKNNTTHVETVTATVTSSTIAPTCTAAGSITYTATASFEGKTYTDTKTVSIEAIGHDYELTKWAWSTDYKTATVTFTCKNNTAHVETVTATVTSKTVDPTCTTTGSITYTATASFEGKTFTDTKTILIDATGHTPGDPVEENHIDPTSDKDGSYDEVVYCTLCGEELSRETHVIPAVPQGWIQTDGKWYYFIDGEMVTGWNTIDEKWYYFNSAGIMLTGWQTLSGKTYYLGAGGAMRTGWQKISGQWYYFSASGAMQTGWCKVSDKWYYLDSSGVMQTGWLTLSGKTYYLGAGGAMRTGWQKLSGHWYYFGTSGAMQTGWQTIDDQMYYLKPTGIMAASEWVNGWWLNADGSWTYPYKASWKQNSKGWWFGDESGWYARNTTITINDKQYTFDSNGYLK